MSLDRHLCFALYSASRVMTADYRPVLTEMNLTYPQYLGERLQLDSGTLSPLLKRLEANGFVRRERSLGDEHLVDVTLTCADRRVERKAQCIPCTQVVISLGLNSNSAGTMVFALNGQRVPLNHQ